MSEKNPALVAIRELPADATPDQIKQVLDQASGIDPQSVREAINLSPAKEAVLKVVQELRDAMEQVLDQFPETDASLAV